jgi:hypothetical protein
LDTQNLCRNGHPHAVEAIKLRRNNRKVRVSTRFFYQNTQPTREGFLKKKKAACGGNRCGYWVFLVGRVGIEPTTR